LDDPKRAVRKAAVKCRNQWYDWPLVLLLSTCALLPAHHHPTLWPDTTDPRFGLKTDNTALRKPAAAEQHRGHGHHGHDHGHDHHGHDHDHDHDGECGAHCNHAHHHHPKHDDEIGAFVFRSNKPFDPARLEEFLGGVVQVYGPDLLRYKGILYMKGINRRMLFQGVHMMMGAEPGKPWTAAEKPSTKMVFIGRKLPQEIFTRGLEQCLAG
jgi:G3E family GTPase